MLYVFTETPTSNDAKMSRLFRPTSSIMRNKSAVLVMVTLGLLVITFNFWNVLYLESKRDCPDLFPNNSQPLVYAAFGRKVNYTRFMNTVLLTGVYFSLNLISLIVGLGLLGARVYLIRKSRLCSR
jgi:hypothetical protein